MANKPTSQFTAISTLVSSDRIVALDASESDLRTATGTVLLAWLGASLDMSTIASGGALPVAYGGTGITSIGTGVATFLGTPSSANLLAAVTDETGTGALVFANSPSLVTPTLGVASATSLACPTFTSSAAIGFTPNAGSDLDITLSGAGKLDISGNANVNTNGTAALFSTFKGADSDGANVWIGGGGQTSVGVSGDTIKGSGNSSFGIDSQISLTTGHNNQAVGQLAQRNLTTGSWNSAFGWSSQFAGTDIEDNTAYGHATQYSISTQGDTSNALQNCAFGVSAQTGLFTGSFNNAFGFRAQYSYTAGTDTPLLVGDENNAFGFESQYNLSSGNSNNAYGHRAQYKVTTGSKNNAFGKTAQYELTVGEANNAIGEEALYLATTGAGNNAFGYAAGGSLTTGGTCTFIGHVADTSLASATNSTAIGNGAIVTASNQVVLGNTSVTETLLRGNVGIGGAATSKLTVVGTAETPARIADFNGTTTAFSYASLNNTGGSLWWGVEGSVAAQLVSGTSAYAAILGTSNATDLYIASSATARIAVLAGGNVGINVLLPTSLLHLGASTTARASLCIPSGTAPTSPVDGDIWSDGSDLKMRLGGVTYTFTKS